MRTILSFFLGAMIIAFVVASPFFYQRWREQQFRNFHVVEEGVLYRSGQLTLPQLQEAVRLHGIRTVISLRDSDKPTDQDEEAWVQGSPGMTFVRLPAKSWWPDDAGRVPADENLAAFRNIMNDPKKHPVLVHCFAGVHRTGTMCAIYRMDYNGWTNQEAMAEMRVFGYTILDKHEDVHGYMKRYRPPAAPKPIEVIPVSRTPF